MKQKKIIRSNRKKWCTNDLENKRGKFQPVVTREIEQEKDGSVQKIQKEWKQLRDVIAVEAEEYMASRETSDKVK